jgi:hypothetical protein
MVESLLLSIVASPETFSPSSQTTPIANHLSVQPGVSLITAELYFRVSVVIRWAVRRLEVSPGPTEILRRLLKQDAEISNLRGALNDAKAIADTQRSAEKTFSRKEESAYLLRRDTRRAAEKGRRPPRLCRLMCGGAAPCRRLVRKFGAMPPVRPSA